MEKTSRTETKIIIVCEDSQTAKIIKDCLEPENELLDNKTQIISTVKENNLEIIIYSTTSISSLRNTIDDIFHTIRLAENVLLKTERET
ncbi:MAG: CTAG/PCC1 family protein [Candidatus Heimdallarchaeum endolithica]|uniref:CTAG/PCC1 family protein n=1 Tax=Candidatus Heimdallarchaeum endolithica TaxID=2876572 RepID=A0A9Y1FMR6_9ARCH|nr:MAG: CTAG/PCC1 family protein [Candidatus Heimdallarchaeum endolithica]